MLGPVRPPRRPTLVGVCLLLSVQPLLARPDQGEPPFDESPEAPYNVIPDALLVNGNLLRVELFADDRGLQVVPLTPLAGLRVTHEMVLVDGDCSSWDQGWRAPELRPPGRNRLPASPATGTVRLKTGTLRNGVALAGTLSDAGGQPLIVVASINHDPLEPRRARAVLDAVIDWVARSRFAPPAPPRAN